MPEKIYHEDEVIVSKEDIHNTLYYMPGIIGNIMNVWNISTLPKKANLPNERIIIDLIGIVKEIYQQDKVYAQYDDLRDGIVKKLKQCIEHLHKTGSLPSECIN